MKTMQKQVENGDFSIIGKQNGLALAAVQMQNATASDVAPSYSEDKGGRADSIVTSGSAAVKVCKNGDPAYAYDILDRVTSMTSPAGTTIYHYNDTTGLLDRITSPQGKVFTYSYNHGQLQSLAYPNGIMASYQFDDNGNLTALDYKKNATTVAQYHYTYDADGMRTSMTDLDGTHNYAYDPLYQIIQATHPSVKNPLEQFQYDAVGNRLQDLTDHYQYNDLNQLTEDDSCLYTYDLDGNMVKKVSKTTGDSTVFFYDIENKLVEVHKRDTLVQYSYDAIGRRISKNVNGTVTNFRYDGDDLILEMDSNDSITASYTFGNTVDDPLMQNAKAQNLFYIKDAIGSVTSLTDSTGNIVKQYAYGIYGDIVSEIGDSSLGVKNSILYAGREYDQETGLYYYRARYYDPANGRFTQEDPMGLNAGDNNLFRYVQNNPANLIDPSGNLTIPFIGWVDLGENIGEESAQYWANQYAKTGNPGAAFMGGMASLWTPCTSNKTFVTLASALSIAQVASKTGPWLGRAGMHPPHHGMGRHFEIIIRDVGKMIIPGKKGPIWFGK